MKVTAVFFNKQKTSSNYDRDKILNDLSKISNIKCRDEIFKKREYKKENLFAKEAISFKVVINLLKYIDYKMCIYFVLFLYAFNVLVTNFGLDLDSNIISFATNIYTDTKKEFDYASVKNIYPVFNDNCYNIEKIDKNNNVVSNIKKLEIPVPKVKEEVIFNEEIKDVADKVDEVANVFNSDDKIAVTKKQMSNRTEIKINDIIINNYSNHFDVDYEALAKKDIYFTKESDEILFYSTHTSESYTNSDKYKFGYSGTFRSREPNYNMISVGNLLTDYLTNLGIKSNYNDTPHDYYNYTTSYSSSRKTLKDVLATKNYSLIVDLHRDAIADLTFSPEVKIVDKTVSQLMFVIGVGSSAYPNENAIENLTLAIKLQLLAEKVYPGLFRPIMIKDATYNQDMNNRALLIECGATGNILDEVYLSMDCLSNLFNLMYIN